MAKDEKKAAEVYLEKKNKSVDEGQQNTWIAEMAKANMGRGGRNTSMDIYNAKVPLGMSRVISSLSVSSWFLPVEAKKAAQLRMMRKEKEDKTGDGGISSWIAAGIDIQEAQ